MKRRAFTLLEVVISLGILATAMVVLIDSQAFAVFSTREADFIIRSTQLAEEKMMEVQILMEREGFSDQDIEEEGDFEEFGAEEFRGDDLHLDLEDELKDFRWAYTVRKIELSMPPNLGGMASDLAGGGYFGEEKSAEMDVGGAPDLGDMGVSGDMITDTLADYIREVRVRVWWGDNEDETDQIELTSHIINPTGIMGAGGPLGASSTSGDEGSGSSGKKGESSRRGGRGGPQKGGQGPGSQSIPQFGGNK